MIQRNIQCRDLTIIIVKILQLIKQILSCQENYWTRREERTSSNQCSVNTNLQGARGDNVNVEWSHESHCSKERESKTQVVVTCKRQKHQSQYNVERDEGDWSWNDKIIIKKGIATWCGKSPIHPWPVTHK